MTTGTAMHREANALGIGTFRRRLTSDPEPRVVPGTDAVTPAEAARLLSVSERSVRDCMKAGTLPRVRVGRHWCVPLEALAPSP
jgi:excisionase family DNA binding protein